MASYMYHIPIVLYILVVLPFSTCQSSDNATSDDSISLDFWPPAIRRPYFKANGLEWENHTTIDVNITLNPEVLSKLRSLKISFECEDTYVCRVTNQSHTVLSFDGSNNVVSMSLTVHGDFVGKTQLVVSEVSTNPVGLQLNYTLDFPIYILRTQKGQILEKAFTYIMAFFIAFNTFMMGTQLQLHAIWKEIKRPIGPIIGFLCQYVGMPLLGWLWAIVFLDGMPGLQFGFFALSCAPGGGMSNMWTILLEGKLDLSMTMTFCSNLAALGMMPFWLMTVGVSFFKGEELYLPFLSILQSLATLIVPGALGVAFSHWKPEYIPKFARAIKIFSFCLVVFVVGWSFYANWYVFLLIRWYTIVPGLTLPLSGYVISYFVCLALTRHHRTSRTVAIETGIQNANMAILVCLMSLPPPDSTLTVVMPACVMMMTGPPLWIWLAVRTIRKKCFGYEDPDLLEDAKADEEKEKAVEKNGDVSIKNGVLNKAKVVPIDQRAVPPDYLTAVGSTETKL